MIRRNFPITFAAWDRLVAALREWIGLTWLGRVAHALADPFRRSKLERQLLEAGVGRDEARVVAWLDLSDEDVAVLVGEDFAALRRNGVL